MAPIPPGPAFIDGKLAPAWYRSFCEEFADKYERQARSATKRGDHHRARDLLRASRYYRDSLAAMEA